MGAVADYSARELSVVAGAVVTWLETRDGWVRVRTAGGAEGWIPSSCLDGADNAD
ncbi:MAG: SH3 domain-containing protein [Gemmatimonadaceae bacterium]|nr:SH3 domain-containing protein [Gemmatimonadaceae bacterium]